MPDINRLMSNALVKDMIFMNLLPRDVVNFQSATGIKLTTEEFERYVNVFRFIIPQRRWLMNKINNEGYTFTAFSKTLHELPTARRLNEKNYIFLLVTDKNGDFVLCNEDFIPSAIFESTELVSTGITGSSSGYCLTPVVRNLLMRFGYDSQHVWLEMLAGRRIGEKAPLWEACDTTSEKSQTKSKYIGPMLQLNHQSPHSTVSRVFGVMQKSGCRVSRGLCWDMLLNDSCPAMYAVMDSNGYTIKHLLPKRLRILGSRQSSNGVSDNGNARTQRMRTQGLMRRRLNREELKQEYEICVSSEDDLESPCSSSDPTASSKSPNHQKKKIETILSLQIRNNDLAWPYKGVVYHIPRTKAECPDKYDGLYRTPAEFFNSLKSVRRNT